MATMIYTNWSIAEDAFLRENAAKGGVFVAQSLGRTPAATRQRAYTLHVSVRKHGKWYKQKRVNGKPILEHRLVMSNILGRKLARSETVHHRNGNKRDNAESNLELKFSNHGPGQSIGDFLRSLGEKVEFLQDGSVVLSAKIAEALL
jgi:hypothetical protein